MPEIILSDPGSEEDCDRILSGLSSFNARQMGVDIRSFSLRLQRKDENDLLGGAYCVLYGRECFVEYMWVREDQRGKGLGTALMRSAEEHCRKKNATRIMLTTWDFQARPFYEKLGMRCDAVIPGHVNGHTLYYLSKLL